MRTIATKLGSSSFYQSETVGSKVRNRTSDLTIVSQDPYTSVHGRLEVKSSLRRTCFTPDPIVVGVCRSRVHDVRPSVPWRDVLVRDVTATISRRQVQRDANVYWITTRNWVSLPVMVTFTLTDYPQFGTISGQSVSIVIWLGPWLQLN